MSADGKFAGTRSGPHTLAPLIALLAIVCCLGCGSAQDRAAELREQLANSNLVVVVVDALSMERTGAGSNPRNTTPYLDQWAQGCVFFGDVSAASPDPLSSTASLFLGEALDQHSLHSVGQKLPNQNWFSHFAEAGYRVQGFSSNPAISAQHGFDIGAEHFAATRPIETSATREFAPNQFLSQANWDQLDKFLSDDSEQPFFLYVHLGTLLPPFAPDASTLTGLVGRHVELSKGTQQHLAKLTARGATPAELLDVIDLYDASLRELDNQLARLCSTLESYGHFEDSLIAITASTGVAFGQHGTLGIGSDLHQESLSVPLWLRLPGGLRAGQKIRVPVAAWDLYPTLADLLELGIQSNSGAVLTPLLSEDVFERRTPIVMGRPQSDARALRSGNFKWIFDPKNGLQSLHQLERDARESRQFNQERPEIVQELRAQLNEWNRRFRKAPEQSGVGAAEATED